MCDQQSLRSACAYAQSDQSLCLSLEYSMSVKLLTEHNVEFLRLIEAAQACLSLHLVYSKELERGVTTTAMTKAILCLKTFIPS